MTLSGRVLDGGRRDPYRVGVARTGSGGHDRRRRPRRRQALPKLDRLVHERLRLVILSALSARDELTFRELKELLRTSDGSLSVHARKLEEAGYLTCTKGFEGRVPRSTFRLTASGRRALERYLEQVGVLIEASRTP